LSGRDLSPPQRRRPSRNPKPLELGGLDLLGLTPGPFLAVPVDPGIGEHAKVIDPVDPVVAERVAILEDIDMPDCPQVFADLQITGEPPPQLAAVTRMAGP